MKESAKAKSDPSMEAIPLKRCQSSLSDLTSHSLSSIPQSDSQWLFTPSIPNTPACTTTANDPGCTDMPEMAASRGRLRGIPGGDGWGRAFTSSSPFYWGRTARSLTLQIGSSIPKHQNKDSEYTVHHECSGSFIHTRSPTLL